MPVVGHARPGAAVDRLLAHLAPQPLEALAVDRDAVVARQDGHQTAASQARVDEVDLVEDALDTQILRVLADGLSQQPDSIIFGKGKSGD